MDTSSPVSNKARGHDPARSPAFPLAPALGALLLAVGSLGLARPAAETDDANPPPSRYRIESLAPAPAASSCGRYAIEVQARYAPQARSADGRYALKAVNLPTVGCNPFPDPLFQNGFETP